MTGTRQDSPGDPCGAPWVTVTDDRRHVAGILTIGAVVRGHRQALEASAGQRQA
jgi:hypothetical protein